MVFAHKTSPYVKWGSLVCIASVHVDTHSVYSSIRSTQRRSLSVPMGLTQRNAMRDQLVGSGHKRRRRKHWASNSTHWLGKVTLKGRARHSIVLFQATPMASQELAHQGSAAKPGMYCSESHQDIDTSAMQPERSQRIQPTGLRQRKQLRSSSRRHVVLLAAVLLVSRSDALLLGAIGDVYHGEPRDASLLTRVKAVKEAAHAVKSAADKWTGQVKQTLHIKETQVRYMTPPCLSTFLLSAGL